AAQVRIGGLNDRGRHQHRRGHVSDCRRRVTAAPAAGAEPITEAGAEAITKAGAEAITDAGTDAITVTVPAGARRRDGPERGDARNQRKPKRILTHGGFLYL